MILSESTRTVISQSVDCMFPPSASPSAGAEEAVVEDTKADGMRPEVSGLADPGTAALWATARPQHARMTPWWRISPAVNAVRLRPHAWW